MDGNRDIKVNGEAYFEVEKLHNIPFTVETHDYNIRVLGTKFNVMAYSDFSRTETSLIEEKLKYIKVNKPFQLILDKHSVIVTIIFL